MKTLFFALIVAAFAIPGIILTALFGTPKVQEDVIPAIAIVAVILPSLWHFVGKQIKEHNTVHNKKNVGAKRSHTVQKKASSELPVAA